MSWPQIVILVWLALSAVVNVLLIGVQRKPTKPVEALISIVALSAIAWLVVIV